MQQCFDSDAKLWRQIWDTLYAPDCWYDTAWWWRAWGLHPSCWSCGDWLDISTVSTQYLQYLHSRYLGWDGRCGRRHASAQTDAENWLAPVEVMGGAQHSSAQFSPAATLLQRNNHSDDFIQLGGGSQQTATMKTFQTVSYNCNIKALNLVCFQ